MKKLALIVLLAVVASRVLADRDGHHPRPHRPPAPPVAFQAPEPPAPPYLPPIVMPPPPGRPGAVPAIAWRGDDEHSVAPAPAPRADKGKGKGKGRSPAGKVVKVAAPAAPEQVMPAWFPKSEWEEEGLARPDSQGMRVVVGRLSASPDRARLDLRKTLDREVAEWLAADIPLSWAPPGRLVDRMIRGTYVRTETRSFGPKPGEMTPEVPRAGGESLAGLDEFYTLYRAGQQLDFSEPRRAEFVEAYRRDVASARMRRSGSIIAVVLALLAATSLYVRADEATKGYYTNRLRALATLGLGAAGAVAYRYWA